ncbi:MAG: protein kinase, partial [Pirellulaceae bacterium]|nr:protein kinase [Pirellulaceae bacterium]
MIDHPPDELAIFRIAHSIQSAELREAYLRQMCRDDASVRDRVVQLLEASQEDPAFLEIPPTGVGPTVEFVSITERPGTQIGPYQLVEELGDGGMGIVYRAAQREPIQREVALKIIKPGMDTQEVLARFQAEEQALARMDHPHVAKVLDAGRTDSGRPYFVMELVHGVTITQYCDDSHLSTRERLELFVQVCHAVQHAHQKGIIHRDLKPSNIL